MYIDCHGHFTSLPDVVKQWRQDQITSFESGARLSASSVHVSDDELREALESAQLARQREYGIDLTLFSPIAGAMAHHYGDQQTSVVWSELANDMVARVAELYPDRFAAVCQLPQSPGAPIDACVAELERCVVDRGFVACNLNPDPSDGYWQSPAITDPYYYPLYERACDLGVPIMVHSSMSRNPAVQATCAHYLNGDTTAFMQLLESDLFVRFPALKIVIPHGGGAVPYHWGRYQGVLADRQLRPLEETLGSNIYIDTCVYWQQGIDLLVGTVPTENLLFASEMIGAVKGRSADTGRYYDDTRSLLEAAPLTPDQLRMISHENALGVYPRLRERLATAASQEGSVQ